MSVEHMKMKLLNSTLNPSREDLNPKDIFEELKYFVKDPKVFVNVSEDPPTLRVDYPDLDPDMWTQYKSVLKDSKLPYKGKIYTMTVGTDGMLTFGVTKPGLSVESIREGLTNYMELVTTKKEPTEAKKEPSEAKKGGSGLEARYDELERELQTIPRGFGREGLSTATKERNQIRVQEIDKEKEAIVAEAMKKYEGKTITLADIQPQVIKQLKPGDSVVLGKSGYYMGDGGDSRDAKGYSFETTVVEKKGATVTTKGGRYGGQESDTHKLTINKEGWLSSKPYQVFMVNGVSEMELKKGLSGAIHTKLYSLYKGESIQKRETKKAEAVKGDWTKSTKSELLAMIETHLSAQGKRITNLGTAKKEKLIELIRKYKIQE